MRVKPQELVSGQRPPPLEPGFTREASTTSRVMSRRKATSSFGSPAANAGTRVSRRTSWAKQRFTAQQFVWRGQVRKAEIRKETHRKKDRAKPLKPTHQP